MTTGTIARLPVCCICAHSSPSVWQGIGKLEGEMQQLRTLITAFASVVQSLKNAAAADPSK